MQLQYFPKTECFTMNVPEHDTKMIQSLMKEHGFDLSTVVSKPGTRTLFTREPYAAVTFWNSATEGAREQLGQIYQQITLSARAESKAHIRLPADCDLWPFQKAGVEYAMSRDHCLIGDAPGLGKTNQAIAIANEMGAERVLVVCPASIRLQWIKRIRDWTTMPWPYILHPILTARNGVHPRANWTVLSYELARTPAIHAALLCNEYDLLVLDEAHYLKEQSSARTQHIFGDHKQTIPPLASRARKVVALTGTPLPNRPKEAYVLAKHLCFDAIDWMSENAFCERFNPSRTIRGRNGAVVANEERVGRVFELQNRLRANFMVRREKHGPRGVMGQLQLPAYDIIQLEKTGPVKQALEAESLLGIDPENLEGADAAVLGHIAVVRRQMGVALAPQICDYVEMLLDGGEDKLVLFGWHIEVLDIYCSRLSKYGIVRIDGRTSAKAKQDRVDDFVANRDIRICIGNMQAMGVGTDGLQHVCAHALIGEPDWVPGNNQQAVDRLDRGGQKGKVQADLFVAPGSIAERILASALRKNKVLHKALDAVL